MQVIFITRIFILEKLIFGVLMQKIFMLRIFVINELILKVLVSRVLVLVMLVPSSAQKYTCKLLKSWKWGALNWRFE